MGENTESCACAFAGLILELSSLATIDSFLNGFLMMFLYFFELVSTVRVDLRALQSTLRVP